MRLNPYLTFGGDCEEALNFYRDCFDGQIISINRFSEGPDEMGGTKIPADFKDKVMHMTLRFGNNVIMASDSVEEVSAAGRVTLCIGADDVDDMTAVFDKLSDGGEVTMPLQDTFWGARFGMFADRFGVKWMFNCESQPE